MPASMTLDEVHAFLDSRPGWIALTTIDRNGYPHTVPIGYFRLGDEVYIGCRAGTQKLKNIERNPRVSLMLESGRGMGDLKGVIVQGDAETRPARTACCAWRARRRAGGAAEPDLPTEPRRGAYIRIVPRRIISWDNQQARITAADERRPYPPRPAWSRPRGSADARGRWKGRRNGGYCEERRRRTRSPRSAVRGAGDAGAPFPCSKRSTSATSPSPNTCACAWPAASTPSPVKPSAARHHHRRPGVAPWR
ncbi:MAG: pyridoxamine 5'-phosphate oxidase family protein [Dehalococcoidia bacterium]